MVVSRYESRCWEKGQTEVVEADKGECLARNNILEAVRTIFRSWDEDFEGARQVHSGDDNASLNMREWYEVTVRSGVTSTL